MGEISRHVGSGVWDEISVGEVVGSGERGVAVGCAVGLTGSVGVKVGVDVSASGVDLVVTVGAGCSICAQLTVRKQTRRMAICLNPVAALVGIVFSGSTQIREAHPLR